LALEYVDTHIDVQTTTLIGMTGRLHGGRGQRAPDQPHLATYLTSAEGSLITPNGCSALTPGASITFRDEDAISGQPLVARGQIPMAANVV
jgi:hypothetical protein